LTNHAFKYTNTSSTVTPPTLSKSAKQHGVRAAALALHADPVRNTANVPVHADACVSAHVAPRQHTPGGGCGHGWGRHSTPLPRYVSPAPVHCASVRIVHAPVLATQHAPIGRGHPAAAHVTPCSCTTPGHCRVSTTAHAPSAKQHARVTGTGHTAAEHADPWIHALVLAHDANVVLVHTPVVWLQHAPVGGCGHGLVGVHACPSVHTLGVAHAITRTNVHAPVVMLQHEPSTGCGQGFAGAHMAFAVHTFPAVHNACTLCTHAPVSGLQHVPVGGCGHGFGSHTRSTVHTLGNGHAT
jgi:hypothetical protein